MWYLRIVVKEVRHTVCIEIDLTRELLVGDRQEYLAVF